jgi:hypothetical protein
MTSEHANMSSGKQPQSQFWLLPREHGATAMLMIPIVCAAILARRWCWSELATLTAAFAALAAKDPMVIMARQRFVWKQQHPESLAAARWLAGWGAILILSGLVLLKTWPVKAVVAMGLGVALFSALAIVVNVKNRQRSTLFQIASAAALTSSSLATSISATGGIAAWSWVLWLLMALQATAGILVVHARLDARIALRQAVPVPERSAGFRRAAQISLIALACVAATTVVLGHGWMAIALLTPVIGYGYDLSGQRNAENLQLSLKKVGQRALALSSLFAVLLIVGFW